MSLDVLAAILTSHGAVAVQQHELPPFCPVYRLSQEGSILVVQTALSQAGYEFASWEEPQFYRDMLVDVPLPSDTQVSTAPQLIIPNRRDLIVPGETQRDYVKRHAAAFLHWLLTPQVYGLMMPVTTLTQNSYP